MAKKQPEGIIVGVHHSASGSKTALEEINAIKRVPSMKAGYLEASRRIRELARIAPGSEVWIETPEFKHGIFSLLAGKARRLGLIVRPVFSERKISRLIGSYMAALALYGKGPKNALEKIGAELTLRENKTQHLKGRPLLDLLNGQQRSAEIMTDMLVLKALKRRPKLIIAGANHIMDAARVLGKSGYKDATPAQTREILKRFDAMRSRREKLIQEKHERLRMRVYKRFEAEEGEKLSNRESQSR